LHAPPPHGHVQPEEYDQSYDSDEERERERHPEPRHAEDRHPDDGHSSDHDHHDHDHDHDHDHARPHPQLQAHVPPMAMVPGNSKESRKLWGGGGKAKEPKKPKLTASPSFEVKRTKLSDAHTLLERTKDILETQSDVFGKGGVKKLRKDAAKLTKDAPGKSKSRLAKMTVGDAEEYEKRVKSLYDEVDVRKFFIVFTFWTDHHCRISSESLNTIAWTLLQGWACTPHRPA